MIYRAIRRRRRIRTLPRGRRILPFGKPVNLVVEQHHLTIQIAPQQMHRVVAANRQAIAVAGDNPNIQIRIGKLHPRRNGGRATVDGVKAVCFHIIWEARRAANAADKHRIFRRAANFRHSALHGFQDRIIPAARAPANLLIGFPILECGFKRESSRS